MAFVNKGGIMPNEQSMMEEYARQISELVKCVSDLKDEVGKLKAQLSLSAKPCYTNEEVLQIFGVTPPTLRKWRNQGLLGYSQIGSTLQYSQQDISEFLKSHHYEAYAA